MLPTYPWERSEEAIASAKEPVLIEWEARNEEEVIITGRAREAPAGTAKATAAAAAGAGAGFPARDAAAASTSPAAEASLYRCTACTEPHACVIIMAHCYFLRFYVLLKQAVSIQHDKHDRIKAYKSCIFAETVLHALYRSMLRRRK